MNVYRAYCDLGSAIIAMRGIHGGEEVMHEFSYWATGDVTYRKYKDLEIQDRLSEEDFFQTHTIITDLMVARKDATSQGLSEVLDFLINVK